MNQTFKCRCSQLEVLTATLQATTGEMPTFDVSSRHYLHYHTRHYLVSSSCARLYRVGLEWVITLGLRVL